MLNLFRLAIYGSLFVLALYELRIAISETSPAVADVFGGILIGLFVIGMISRPVYRLICLIKESRKYSQARVPPVWKEERKRSKKFISLPDDPRAELIFIRFEREMREGRGADCQRSLSGCKPKGVPLDPEERVYGIYKDKYFFTPLSLIIKKEREFEKVRWDSIVNCSSRHGDRAYTADLTLVDGSIVTVPVGDFTLQPRGEFSRLFHRMIYKWGARATFGPFPLSIEEFFAAADADYCLAPNLMPNPPREQMRAALLALRDRDEIADVLVDVLEILDGVPHSQAVIIRTPRADLDVSDFIREFQADGMMDAPENTIRFFPPGDLYTKLIVWD
jgi:hypothetical protein